MRYPWQSKQWEVFSQQKRQQRLPHAVLLTGVAGLGKFAFAEDMAASILCADESRAEACGVCHSCQLYLAGNHPDHFVIRPEDEGKQIKIEQIRSLKSKQELTSMVSNWKTVIIEPADKMNISANNSLLKLLEEPEQNTLIILVSSAVDKLPITILSRCQKMVFTSPSADEMLAWLHQQGTYDATVITPLIPLAKGAPLSVKALLESNVADSLEVFNSAFESLLRFKGNPIVLAKQWQQYDIMMGLNYLQNNVQARLERLDENTNQQLVRRYWYIYDCIIAAIKLTSSSNNINKTLLIEQFMVSVMDKNWDDSGINSLR